MANTVSAPLHDISEFGQRIGLPLPASWTPPPPPSRQRFQGQYCYLEAMNLDRDAQGLFDAYSDDDGSMWTYLGIGPFDTVEELRAGFTQYLALPDSLTYTISTDAGPVGSLSYLRMNPQQATVEIGLVAFSPRLQRTTAATEALYLVIRHAFDIGYRRVEWKHDSLNDRSRAAAVRLGFQYEGTFRKAVVYKGRNRDTSWLSITDDEWPEHQRALKQWLKPSNFNVKGQQLSSLGTFRIR